MNKREHYRQRGYQQGFDDGEKTGGKINTKYVKNLFKSETKNLPSQESLLYELGWNDGFTDAVSGALKCMVSQENCISIEVEHAERKQR